jgi:hypothetical protein
MNPLTIYLYSFQFIRKAIGGNWYLIADYNRDRAIWTPYFAEGYQVLQREYWA